MNHKKGIVLRTIKYGDNGVIVDMFTDDDGRKSFFVKRSSAKGKNASAGSLWAPLSQIEFVEKTGGKNTLPRIAEARHSYLYSTIYFDSVKSVVALFVSEYLCYALRDETRNRPLFEFIANAARWLDVCEKGVANFHILFLLKLMHFLGIYPDVDTYCENAFFDMRAGVFTASHPAHGDIVPPQLAKWVPLLSRMNFYNLHLFKFNRSERNRCLELINDYYRLHIPAFPQVKSLEILKEVFD